MPKYTLDKNGNAIIINEFNDTISELSFLVKRASNIRPVRKMVDKE